MENLSTDEIIAYLRQNRALLNERFGVTRIGIFGSFARGEQSVTSDVDMNERKKSALHVVCDYSNKDIIDLVTAYVPQRPWWISPVKRGRKI